MFGCVCAPVAAGRVPCARSRRRSGSRHTELRPSLRQPVTGPSAAPAARAARRCAGSRDAGRVSRRRGPSPSEPARSSSSTSVERRPARLGHEAGDLARLEHVRVERDVRAVRAVERALEPVRVVRRPPAAMNSSSGGSRLRAPTSATSSGSTAPASISIRSGIPHALPDGEDSGVFRSPCASSQTTARRSWRAASPSTAPTCAQQQPPSTSGRSGSSPASASVCSPSVSSSTTAASGIGERQRGRLRHRLAAAAPGARHADEAGARTRARRRGTGTRARARPP